MKVDVREEQLLSLEFYVVRNADIAYVAPGPRGADRLHHRLLSADALQNCVCPETLRQILDADHTFITALRHDVCRAKLQSELLSFFVPAHGDDPFRAHLPGGEHGQQTYGSVADDSNRHAWPYVSCVGGKPPRPQNIRGSEKVRNHLLRRNSGSRHESAVRKRNSQQRSLGSAYEFSLLAGGRITKVAVRARVVRSKEGADDELAWFNNLDPAAYLLNDAAVLVPHRCRLVYGADAAIAPQVRSADTCSRDPNDGSCWLGDLWFGDVLKSNVPHSVKYSSLHELVSFALAHDVAAVDRDRLAGNVARGRAAEPQDSIGDLLGPSQSAHRHEGIQHLIQLFSLTFSDHLVGHGRLNHAWAHVVNANAARGIFERRT